MGLESRSHRSESRFASYVEAMTAVLGHADRFAPFQSYCAGLLLPGDRESVEPMAARSGQGLIRPGIIRLGTPHHPGPNRAGDSVEKVAPASGAGHAKRLVITACVTGYVCRLQRPALQLASDVRLQVTPWDKPPPPSSQIVVLMTLLTANDAIGLVHPSDDSGAPVIVDHIAHRAAGDHNALDSNIGQRCRGQDIRVSREELDV